MQSTTSKHAKELDKKITDLLSTYTSEAIMASTSNDVTDVVYMGQAILLYNVAAYTRACLEAFDIKPTKAQLDSNLEICIKALKKAFKQQFETMEFEKE